MEVWYIAGGAKALVPRKAAGSFVTHLSMRYLNSWRCFGRKLQHQQAPGLACRRALPWGAQHETCCWSYCRRYRDRLTRRYRCRSPGSTCRGGLCTISDGDAIYMSTRSRRRRVWPTVTGRACRRNICCVLRPPVPLVYVRTLVLSIILRRVMQR